MCLSSLTGHNAQLSSQDPIEELPQFTEQIHTAATENSANISIIAEAFRIASVH